MATTLTAKATDKAQACKKTMSLLQKEYGKSLPRLQLPVLETMLFAVCLEDNSWEKAEAGLDKLLRSYFDLNEIRVSSVSEIEATLSDLRGADWKGLRIRNILRFVFETTYSFDFEKLTRLTLESAQKRLKKIGALSPFVINFTIQQSLGGHVVCLDHICHRAAIHLGLVPPNSTIEEATEFLKAGVKKADAFAFSCLLRSMATDPRFESRIEEEFEEEEFDVLRVQERFEILKAPKKRKKVKKKAAAKPQATKRKSSSAKNAASTPVTKKKTTKKSSSAASNSKPAKKKTAASKKTAATAGKKSATGKKKKTAASSKGKSTASSKKSTASKAAAKKKTTRKAAPKKKTKAKTAPRKKK